MKTVKKPEASKGDTIKKQCRLKNWDEYAEGNPKQKSGGRKRGVGANFTEKNGKTTRGCADKKKQGH